MKKDQEIIELYDEDGNLVKLNVEAFFDIVNPDTDEKTEYVVVFEEGYDDDVFVLRVETDEDGEDLLIPVDNEVELAQVQEAYNTIFTEE